MSDNRPLIDGSTPVVQEQYLDRDKLMRFLPKGSRHQITDALIDKIKTIQDDSGILQEYAEERILTHMGVLKEVKVSVEQYVDAVKFVALTQSGISNSQAYEIVFPAKIKELQDRGSPLSTSWSSMYNQNEIVTKLRVAMHTPIKLLYQPYEQHALQTLYNLTRGETPIEGQKVSASVMKDSAIGMLNYFKEQDQGNTINIGVGVSEELVASNNNMAKQLEKLAAAQQAAAESGVDISKVQQLGIVFTDVEVIDE